MEQQQQQQQQQQQRQRQQQEQHRLVLVWYWMFALIRLSLQESSINCWKEWNPQRLSKVPRSYAMMSWNNSTNRLLCDDILPLDGPNCLSIHYQFSLYWVCWRSFLYLFQVFLQANPMMSVGISHPTSNDQHPMPWVRGPQLLGKLLHLGETQVVWKRLKMFEAIIYKYL